MAHKMTKMIRYSFLTKEDRDKAEEAVSKHYPQLRTNACMTHSHGRNVFTLFVESTKSLIFDLKVESLMKNSISSE